jgi:two-component system sporulation sensor kinase B
MQDIKSPILTIKHYSNLISRIDIPEQIKKVLTMLSMQANSVVDIMQATFDFSEDRSFVKLQKVQFNENLANILELLSEYTESRNVKLFRKYGDDVQVDIDPRRFYVVCFQVIKNACEAMPSGGKIFVNTELLNGSVTLNIRDEGFGIRDEIKNNIFNAFFSSGKENATGLGLAIAKYLITLMNGSISFESKINEGTKMIIRLPIAEE